jgi:hypothetical protein
VFSGSAFAKNQLPAFVAAAAVSRVLVNGAAVTFDAYNIDGGSCFSLRDVARRSTSARHGTARKAL